MNITNFMKKDECPRPKNITDSIFVYTIYSSFNLFNLADQLKRFMSFCCKTFVIKEFNKICNKSEITYNAAIFQMKNTFIYIN